jgi:hypothetical protein
MAVSIAMDKGFVGFEQRGVRMDSIGRMFIDDADVLPMTLSTSAQYGPFMDWMAEHFAERLLPTPRAEWVPGN